MHKPEHTEFARAAAWADAGHADIDSPPDGWPDGVDAEAYTAAYVERYVPKETTPPPTEPPSKLVDQFRSMIDAD